ncbi:hypothetical protein [Pontibacter pamirensis]|uniref:hypothetical protein n=1 Tax=Pontibacter pamirensis TaxID=2562824 RepID=UPI00138A6759|nr:hypothetical protein [Pontibacter pamirensis]
MKLIDHRRNIQRSADAYTKDLVNDRLVGTLINHLKHDFIGVRFNAQNRTTVKEIISLLFEAQNKRPFFHIEGTELPLCWNRPADWDCDYI